MFINNIIEMRFSRSKIMITSINVIKFSYLMIFLKYIF